MVTNDVFQHFVDRLREAGLAVECVEADGLLHRCGVLDKPSGTDGTYKAFLDAPAPSGGRTGGQATRGRGAAYPART